MKLWQHRFFLISFVFLLIASCVPGTPAPTPTPVPTFSPVPASTPVPSPIPTNTPTLTPTATPVVPEAKIRMPIDGGEVELKTIIEGISKNIPDGSVIWIVIYLPSVNRYYPTNEPAVAQTNGEWSALAQFGREDEVGLEADIIVVIADSTVQAAFLEYLTKAIRNNDFSGMDGLPAPDIVYDRISVTRK